MNSTNVREIVERVLASVNVDATRDSGIVFKPFLSWLEGNLDILDENGNPIHVSQREKISAELMNVEIMNSIVQFCKNKYITLHPDIWKVFNCVTTWRLISKIIKNLLPVTNLQHFQVDIRENQAKQKLEASPVVLCLKSFLKVDGYGVVDLLIKIMEAREENAYLLMQLVNLGILLTNGLENIERWFVHRCARVIAGMQKRVQRNSFKYLMLIYPRNKEIIAALLESGSKAGDMALDIIELLQHFDDDALGNFLYDDARVIHRNYFLRLFVSRRDLGRFTTPGGTDITYESEIIRLLMLSNPWALQRQFSSWQKRITKRTLVHEKLEMLKSSIGRLLEMARRSMVFSREFSFGGFRDKKVRKEALQAGVERESFLSMRWKPVSKLESMDVNITPVHPLKLATNFPDLEHVEDICRDLSLIGMQEEEEFFTELHVLEIKKPLPIPGVFPLEFKELPWISIKGNRVIGLGLPGLRMKKIPAFLASLENLKILDLSDNLFKKIVDLPFPESLVHVDLSRNLLYRLEFGNNSLSRCKTLDLHANYLKGLDLGLVSPALKILDLSRNVIRDAKKMDRLGDCAKLAFLNLSWNRLRDISFLPGLPRLRFLFLQGNELVRIGKGETQPVLGWLDLSHNNLGALKDLQRFPIIHHLDARHNYLKQIKDIKKIKHLNHVDVRDNQLQDVSPILESPSTKGFKVSSNPLGEMSAEFKHRVA